MAYWARARDRIVSLQSTFGVTLLILLGAVGLGLLVAKGDADFFRLLLIGLGSLAVVPLIVLRPELGLVITFASLSLESLFAELPLASATLSGVGALTLLGYLLRSRSRPILTTVRYPQFYWAFAWVLWIAISDPSDAFGTKRLWIVTYVQLLMLIILASELITIERIKLLTGAFMATATLSTLFALSQVQLSNSIRTTSRGTGLAQNENELAAYLDVAFVFGIALANQFRKRFWLLLGFAALTVLMALGVMASVSRAGFIALGVELALICLLGRQLTAISGKRYFAALVIFAMLLLLAIALIPPSYWNIVSEAGQSISAGESAKSTYSLRLGLWDLAMKLWSQNPVVGIGIGQFQYMNPRGFVVHNMYISVLSETGLIGMVLYVFWLGSTFLGFLKVILRSPNRDHVSLATAWFIALIGFCVVSTVDSFQNLKITWLAAGISIVFQQSLASSVEAKTRST